MGVFDILRKKSSGDIAKKRLQLLLVSDRANDIIKLIAKYMEIDTDGLDIQITQTEAEGDNVSVPALIANIPIKELKHGK